MLTIFTAPKPFEGHIGVIQRNAIRSWMRLKPVCEVILVGEETGLPEFAAEHGLKLIKNVECNEFGTPLMSSIFAQAEAAARYDVLAYVNADIILLNDFTAAVQQIRMPRFLMVGRRQDIDITTPIDFDSADWDERLRADVTQRAVYNIPWAIDYFVHSRGLWAGMPPFAIGRFAFDNWLIYDAVRQGAPVITATDVVTAVHQNHAYRETAAFSFVDRTRPECRRNFEMCGRGEDYSVRDATLRLSLDSNGEYCLRPNYVRYLSHGKRLVRRALGITALKKIEQQAAKNRRAAG